MAVPKHKTSKQRTHTRGANWKIQAPALGKCPQCHELKESHRICPNCGYYDGELKMAIKEEKE